MGERDRGRGIALTPAVLLALVGLPVLVASCGERATSMELSHTLDSLLARWDEVRVQTSHPARAPHVGPLAPIPGAHTDAGVLPCAILPPPCEVAWTLPVAAPGARLELAAGLGRGAYGGDSCRVRFEVLLDGETLFDRSLLSGPGVGPQDRLWSRAEVDVSRGGKLVLRTSLVSGSLASGSLAPEEVGFGLLRRVTPVSVERVASGPDHPNVVLVVIDTLRADRLGTYGDGEARSPTLDSLGERGTVFERAYSASSWTWPSTASILTGASTVRHGLEDPEHCFLADEFLTLPEAFQLQGVTTAGFSCNPMVSAGKNFDQGFETWREYSWTLTRDMLPDVAAWLDEHAGEQFFLYLQVIDPHTPYRPSDRHRAGFRTERERFKKKELLRLVESRVSGEAYPEHRLLAEVDRMQRLYRASVASVDDDMATLMGLLEERGLADDTIVAVTSDHGEEFLEHDLLGHANQLYDESVHVPLILVGPSVPSGVRESRPVENRALAATLMALAGVEVPRELAALSLIDTAALERTQGDPIFFAVHNGSWPDRSAAELHPVPQLFAVQHGPLRLLWAPGLDSGSSERVALFDLERDAAARNDLAPDRPADVERLRAVIEAWRARELAQRPALLPGGTAAAAELRAMGYGGSQDD